MDKLNLNEIQKLFAKNNVNWFINIFTSTKKVLEYSPLYKEISVDSSNWFSTNINIIKNNKKWVYNIDWCEINDIQNWINEILKVIDLAEFDKDIIVPQITDSIEKDFSVPEIETVDFQMLENEFNKVKNYKFNDFINIESFSIWIVSYSKIFINSLWSIKTQSDNSSFYSLELVWENDFGKDSDYIYKDIKWIPNINLDEIKELEKLILNKISGNNQTFNSWNYDIVLDKDVVIDFIDIIIENLWAEDIREWVSLFSKNKIWDKIFGDDFTLINNPDLPWYTGNSVFDWEWVTTKKTVILDKWVFLSKFYNYKNALKEWLENLWNSSIYNIELIKSKTYDENILAWNKILFTNLMALHTVDASTWKYSLNWEWYLIENWKKWDFIKNISLSWNVIDLFSNIKNIWNDYKTYWNYRVPSISFYNQKVV